MCNISHQRNVKPEHSVYHSTPTKMAVIKKRWTITGVDENVEKLEPSHVASENVK